MTNPGGKPDPKIVATDGLSGKQFQKDGQWTIVVDYTSLLRNHIGILIRGGYQGVVCVDCHKHDSLTAAFVFSLELEIKKDGCRIEWVNLKKLLTR